MIKILWDKILSLFGKKKQDYTEAEINNEYKKKYEDTKDINFTAIFSNKLANYVVNDSNIDLKGDDKRTELLKKVIKKIKKRLKKIVSRGLGVGGVLIIPYVTNRKIYFDIISQDRMCINKKIGDEIVDCTILAEEIVKNKNHYFRWADYTLEDNNLKIKYKATLDAEPIQLSSVSEWSNIEDVFIPNVEKMPFMYLKSPIDNRQEEDDYGVPITFGCEKQICEIKDTLKQILREYDLKEAFVGADQTMFKGDNALPSNGLYKKINSGEDNFWEIFDPAFRDTSLYNKLMNQCIFLEKQIGTSRGILSDPLSTYQNTDETRRALYDTFSIVDDIRGNVTECLEDFLYACEILANYYNLAPPGKYEISIDWDYTFIEDTTSQWNQLVQGKNNGVIKKVELRQFIKPEEDIDKAQAVIDEIASKEPTTRELLGE